MVISNSIEHSIRRLLSAVLCACMRGFSFTFVENAGNTVAIRLNLTNLRNIIYRMVFGSRGHWIFRSCVFCCWLDFVRRFFSLVVFFVSISIFQLSRSVYAVQCLVILLFGFLFGFFFTLYELKFPELCSSEYGSL